jgi:hypothetical protein
LTSLALAGPGEIPRLVPARGKGMMPIRFEDEDQLMEVADCIPWTAVRVRKVSLFLLTLPVQALDSASTVVKP